MKKIILQSYYAQEMSMSEIYTTVISFVIGIYVIWLIYNIKDDLKHIRKMMQNSSQFNVNDNPENTVKQETNPPKDTEDRNSFMAHK